MKKNNFTEELKKLPALPGVYLMKDENGHIIYIGKAVNLKRRVGSYFRSKHKLHKTEKLVAHIKAFEIILTDTELEALVLECRLIKEHKPQYNSLMKNDWRYPYIKITNELFPRVITETSPTDDGAVYFGPYKGYEDVERILHLVKRLWGIRNCNTQISSEHKKAPCFYFHIGECKGPCGGNVSLEEYLTDIENIKSLLRGHYSETVNRIKKEMNTASQNMYYERAAVYRDKLLLLQTFVKRQKILLASLEEKDMLIFTDSHIENTILIILLRYGRILDKAHIDRDTPQADIKAQITEFLSKHYAFIQPVASAKKNEIKKSEIDEIIVIQGWLHHTKAKKACVEVNRSKLKHPLDTAVEMSMAALVKNRFLSDTIQMHEETRQS